MTKEELLNDVFEAVLHWDFAAYSGEEVPKHVVRCYFDVVDRVIGSNLVGRDELSDEVGRANRAAYALLK
jgi:hypothetical protein